MTQPLIENTNDAEPLPIAANLLYQEIPVGLTEEGYPYVGAADAPITLVEFSDFLCPFCQRHFQQTYPVLLDKYIRSGQVKLIFRQFPLPSLHPTAPRGAMAALCLAQQSPRLFWMMHDELFLQQDEWSQLAEPDSYLEKLATTLGADRTLYQHCMADDQVHALVQQDITAGEALGFNATPSFQLLTDNGKTPYQLVGALPAQTFAQWFDALAAGKEPPQAIEAAKPELPLWAKTEGLAPDPSRPGYTLAGDQYKGAADAAITIIEFSDFQCPACATHAREVQPAIDQALLEQGQVRWVFKHFPLREHRYAPLLAAAAECAAAQNAFWPMYDRLFDLAETWDTQTSLNAAETQVNALAAQLHLDRQPFQACLNSRDALESVLRDLQDGQGLIQQTPTFIILNNDTGTLVKGSRPAAEFITLLRSFVEQDNLKKEESLK